MPSGQLPGKRAALLFYRRNTRTRPRHQRSDGRLSAAAEGLLPEAEEEAAGAGRMMVAVTHPWLLVAEERAPAQVREEAPAEAREEAPVAAEARGAGRRRLPGDKLRPQRRRLRHLFRRPLSNSGRRYRIPSRRYKRRPIRFKA